MYDISVMTQASQAMREHLHGRLAKAKAISGYRWHSGGLHFLGTKQFW